VLLRKLSDWTKRTAPLACLIQKKGKSLQNKLPDDSVIISQRLVIKNNSQNARMPWPSNENEQNLRNFWWHISQYYFKKIETIDLERIDYLLNLFNTPLKSNFISMSICSGISVFKFSKYGSYFQNSS
jgi:hypothetical protein